MAILNIWTRKNGNPLKGKRSAAKKVVSTKLHKSPQKALQRARRNLCFDKSPRKRVTVAGVTTPQKKVLYLSFLGL